MDLLEEITHPQPLKEFLDAAFAVYSASQAWVTDFELHPKSVVRDMYERAMTFGDYINYYKLARSEGLVLRYLSDAYRAARQTIPTRPRPRSCSTSSSGWASWCGRSTRACSTSGTSWSTRERSWMASRCCRPLRPGSRPTRGRSGPGAQ
ncbi:MAG: DUF3516 domain-containing protein [Galbitalea sp.]